jgi:hypothetical protein
MRTTYLLLFLLFSLGMQAQDGLEHVVVEKFYTSTKADMKGEMHSGDLPEGSVTYRIYVDLKPGYRFQAAFGSPGHPLKFISTKPFFNHIESGATHPNILPERALNHDVALLDSWLSVGAAGENHLGVLKQIDSSAVDTYVHFESGFLKGKSGRHDFSLQEKDGMQRAEHLPFPTFYQMDSCLKHLGSSTNSSEIILQNGAWASMGKGSVGVDSLTTNHVLIAQLTTAGEFSFELNLLIGAPNGTSQKYVARNPQYDEWIHNDLIFSSKNMGRGKKNKKEKKNRQRS